MSGERHLERMRRAVEAAQERGFAALVVAPSPDLAYLAGYSPMPLERPTLLMLREDREPAMLVPRLERPLAAASPAGATIQLVPWDDGEDPYAKAIELLPSGGKVAVCDRMWSVHLLALQRRIPAAEFVSAAAVMAELRSVKDEEELETLRGAAAAADRCFEQIVQAPFAGRTEGQVAADLARLLVENGHAMADFTIVAGGPNSASPHHEPGDRPIRSGDAVVLDFGGELDGYFSDTTRTVVVGEPPPGFEEVYALVLEAQEAAVQAVRPGIPAESVDAAARSIIDAAGFGDRFVHRTGHGIGLEVHESPYIVRGNAQELKAGMTFSVEPGIYLEGRFGVRIEDIVAVTEGGVERLNRSTHDLQIVA